jgi:hypothetical protein
MKRSMYASKIAPLSILCALIGGLWFGVSKFLTVRSLSVSSDVLLHHDVLDEVREKIEGLMQDKVFSSALSSALQESYPFLEEVSGRFGKGGSVHISTKASMPICLINKSSLLLENQQLVSKSTFIDEAVSDLPNITIPEMFDNELPQTLCLAIQKIPLELFERYEVTIFDETDIQFVDKHQLSFVIRADNQTCLAEFLERCTCIKEDLKAKGSFHTYNTRWIVDIRFKDQIIVRSVKRKGGAL